jgi:DNA-binding MarR family transcriptional regulator
LDAEDRRYVVIQLTENGLNVFRNIEDSMDRYYASILDSIPEDKRKQVLESLQLIIDAVKNNRCC